jgi:cysteine desulfurase
MLANRERGNHLVTTQIEHEAVLRACRFVESLGFDVTYVAPDEFGFIAPQSIAAAMTARTVLVSVMHANNEVGTIQDVASIAEIAHAGGAYFHTDAVQTFGLMPVNADQFGADLISISAHKIYGPKGAGALYARDGIKIEPLIHGGGQERERRAGTENVSGIAGFATAVRLAVEERDTLSTRLTPLRDRLIDRLLKIPGALLNGHPTNRLTNNVNVSFPPLEAEPLLLALDLAGVSASSGSACTSGSIEPSHVLISMGLDEARVKSAIRFTLGRSTTESGVDRAAEIVSGIVARQRQRM